MALPTASDNEFPKIILEEVASDGSATVTPAADHRALLLGEDGALHLKDSSGTVTDVSSASGAPTDAEYVVTAANGSLSAEKVVFAPAAGGTIAKVVRKTSNETVNNSATLQDDDALLLALAASEVWEFEIELLYDSGTTPDIKCALTVPAAATLRWTPTGVNAGGTTYGSHLVETTSGGSRDFQGTGVGTMNRALMTGIVVNGANAGNLQLQWAQQTANASDTTVFANSRLRARRLA